MKKVRAEDASKIASFVDSIADRLEEAAVMRKDDAIKWRQAWAVVRHTRQKADDIRQRRCIYCRDVHEIYRQTIEFINTWNTAR